MSADTFPVMESPVDDGYKTLQKVVTDRLRALILAGKFAPGARLQQDELAKQFRVSRMPIREALRTLESEGFVELRAHRGAVVVNLQEREIAEIFEIRALLEGRAAALAAARLSEGELARLDQLYGALIHTADEEDCWLSLNHEFHMTIYTASGWPRLCALIVAQRNVVLPYLRASFALLDRAATAQEEHRRILCAAQERDGAALSRHSVDHLRTTARLLVDYLATTRRETAAVVASDLAAG